MTLLEHALNYAGGNRPVFPVSVDKKPLTEHGFKDATTEAKTIRRWWGRWPDAGIATPTGGGLFVLDADDEQALRDLEKAHEALPPTVAVVTPRPGVHYYLKGNVSNNRGQLPAGLDVRGNGGYVLLPPSPHQNGVYEWRTAPDEVPIAPAPGWLLALLSYGQNGNGHAPAVGESIPAGLRNSTLASMAGTMRRRGFEADEIAAALLVVNRNRCKPPMPDSDVREIARSISRYQPAPDLSKKVSELAQLLGLNQVKKRIDKVQVFGRGLRGAAFIHLDDGERIVLDPIGAYTTAPKLAAEIAIQCGASPALKGAQVQSVIVLLYWLGDHIAAVEVEDKAVDYGTLYLRETPVQHVDMSDQQSRWEAFAVLERVSEPQRIVLEDVKSKDRYVRIGWLEDWIRARSGPGEPDAAARQLSQQGWLKSGTQGRIKATRPGFKDTLTFRFFRVPEGWEHR